MVIEMEAKLDLNYGESEYGYKTQFSIPQNRLRW